MSAKKKVLIAGLSIGIGAMASISLWTPRAVADGSAASDAMNCAGGCTDTNYQNMQQNACGQYKGSNYKCGGPVGMDQNGECPPTGPGGGSSSYGGSSYGGYDGAGSSKHESPRQTLLKHMNNIQDTPTDYSAQQHISIPGGQNFIPGKQGGGSNYGDSDKNSKTKGKSGSWASPPGNFPLVDTSHVAQPMSSGFGANGGVDSKHSSSSVSSSGGVGSTGVSQSGTQAFPDAFYSSGADRSNSPGGVGMVKISQPTTIDLNPGVAGGIGNPGRNGSGPGIPFFSGGGRSPGSAFDRDPADPRGPGSPVARTPGGRPFTPPGGPGPRTGQPPTFDPGETGRFPPINPSGPGPRPNTPPGNNDPASGSNSGGNGNFNFNFSGGAGFDTLFFPHNEPHDSAGTSASFTKPDGVENFVKAVGVDKPPVSGQMASAGVVATAMAGASIMANKLKNMPGNNSGQAKSNQNSEKQSGADNLALMERYHAAAGIEWVKSFLENFTTAGGNKWNQVRDKLFVPMAILLLLPGAAICQLKSIASQGLVVLGEVQPFEGIFRSIVGIFLIPATYLVVNYGIDVANSLTDSVATSYRQIFGSDMYTDALCGHIRAFPVREPDENPGQITNQEAVMFNYFGTTPLARLEGKTLSIKYADPCVGLYIVPPDRNNDNVPYYVNEMRLAINQTNAAFTMAWVILCAVQQAYLYYLWFVGPVIAACWVYPSRQLREAFPSWIEGVVTLCCWSLFWSIAILLMACFHGVDDTGTFMFTALNFLVIGSAKFAFDFTGLVKDAGREAMSAAQKAASAVAKGGKGGGGGGGGSGGGNKGGQGSPKGDNKGGDEKAAPPDTASSRLSAPAVDGEQVVAETKPPARSIPEEKASEPLSRSFAVNPGVAKGSGITPVDVAPATFPPAVAKGPGAGDPVNVAAAKGPGDGKVPGDADGNGRADTEDQKERNMIADAEKKAQTDRLALSDTATKKAEEEAIKKGLEKGLIPPPGEKALAHLDPSKHPGGPGAHHDPLKPGAAHPVNLTASTGPIGVNVTPTGGVTPTPTGSTGPTGGPTELYARLDTPKDDVPGAKPLAPGPDQQFASLAKPPAPEELPGGPIDQNQLRSQLDQAAQLARANAEQAAMGMAVPLGTDPNLLNTSLPTPDTSGYTGFTGATELARADLGSSGYYADDVVSIDYSDTGYDTAYVNPDAMQLSSSSYAAPSAPSDQQITDYISANQSFIQDAAGQGASMGAMAAFQQQQQYMMAPQSEVSYQQAYEQQLKQEQAQQVQRQQIEEARQKELREQAQRQVARDGGAARQSIPIPGMARGGAPVGTGQTGPGSRVLGSGAPKRLLSRSSSTTGQPGRPQAGQSGRPQAPGAPGMQGGRIPAANQGASAYSKQQAGSDWTSGLSIANIKRRSRTIKKQSKAQTKADLDQLKNMQKPQQDS